MSNIVRYIRRTQPRTPKVEVDQAEFERTAGLMRRLFVWREFEALYDSIISEYEQFQVDVFKIAQYDHLRSRSGRLYVSTMLDRQKCITRANSVLYLVRQYTECISSLHEWESAHRGLLGKARREHNRLMKQNASYHLMILMRNIAAHELENPIEINFSRNYEHPAQFAELGVHLHLDTKRLMCDKRIKDDETLVRYLSDLPESEKDLRMHLAQLIASISKQHCQIRSWIDGNLNSDEAQIDQILNCQQNGSPLAAVWVEALDEQDQVVDGICAFKEPITLIRHLARVNPQSILPDAYITMAHQAQREATHREWRRNRDAESQGLASAS